MPLFKCSVPECGALENTALGDFWMPRREGKPVRCSECATGTWHGRFDKRTPEEAGYVLATDGWYYTLAQLQPGTPEAKRGVMPADLVGLVDSLRGATPKRRQLPEGECAYCDRERTAGNNFFPSHDASDRCESGKHPHCTCDTCF